MDGEAFSWGVTFLIFRRGEGCQSKQILGVPVEKITLLYILRWQIIIFDRKETKKMWEPSLCLILSSYDTLLLNDVVETNNFAAEYHLSLTAFLWEPEKDISQAEVKVGNYLFDLQLLLE